MAKGSSSFRFATQLFGRTLREDVWQLYAWCRYCDDEIDGQDHGHDAAQPSTEEPSARLDRLRRLTTAALAAEPVEEPAFKAFQRVALQHGLPARWPLELLGGFAMDVEQRAYATTEDLLEYCWGVAGVVGVMMAIIMGVQDEAVLRRAQDLGIACQLTNICRDIAEDAATDRVYLPSDLLAGVGLSATHRTLAAPENRAALFGVVRDMLALAERYYTSSRAGLRFLPFRGALAVAAARNIYREIGRRILRKGPEALGARMTVPKPAMVLLVMKGILTVIWSRLEPRQVPVRAQLWTRV